MRHTAPFFLGIYFWTYSVVQKAAHDSARVLASATRLEIATTRADYTEVNIARLAREIVAAETSDLLGGPMFIDIDCDGETCLGDAVPTKVRVLVRRKAPDPVFSWYTTNFGGEGLYVRADVTMPYVGY